MTASLFDIPVEVLVQIIEHLNARERIVLSNCCHVLKRLVLQERHLLRDLDFSEDGHLTSESDIREYFDDEDVSKHVRKVNLRNVNCIESGPLLNNLIGRAINLVDIDIHGTIFTDVQQMAAFLKPLVHIERLGVNFPETIAMNSAGYENLKESFGRLRHLSVRLTYNNHEYSSEINFILHTCTKLEDLRIFRANMISGYANEYISRTNPKILPNLKFVEFTGRRSYVVKNYLIHKVLPDPQKWTEFERVDPSLNEIFTLVKDLRIAKEIRGSDVIRTDPSNAGGEFDTMVLPVILSERLLEQVVRNTHKNVPQKFCSLSRSSSLASTAMFKTEETKRLLENPRCPISYLYFDHDIERECDAHLVVSTFPSITNLHLFNIVKSRARPKRSWRCRRNEQSAKSDEQNKHSCFKMFVQNTPNIRELTMSGRQISKHKIWDFDALHQMKNWKNLRALRLHFIPIRSERDGQFLIEIGKHCKQLETLDFQIFGKSDATLSYMKSLSRMLTHCQNLKDFSIRQESIGKVSDVFNWFTNNPELRRICVLSRGETDDGIEIIHSIERFIHRSSKLTTLLFRIDGLSSDVSRELLSTVKRIRDELNRPRFPIQENYISNSDEAWIFDRVHKDSSLYWYPCSRITNYFWQNSSP